MEKVFELEVILLLELMRGNILIRNWKLRSVQVQSCNNTGNSEADIFFLMSSLTRQCMRTLNACS